MDKVIDYMNKKYPKKCKKLGVPKRAIKGMYWYKPLIGSSWKVRHTILFSKDYYFNKEIKKRILIAKKLYIAWLIYTMFVIVMLFIIVL